MKITKSKLIQIIQEETQKTVSESWADMLAATGDMEKIKKAETQADMIEKIPDLMRADSQDPQAFIQWVQEYDPSDWTQEDTAKTREILNSSPNLGKEVQKYIKNVNLFTRTEGEKGHQYTEEPWNARYMKTLQKWVQLDHKNLRNHLAYVMVDYIQDELLGGLDNIGVNPYDAGLAPYGDED
tara:strand:+ start:402 stop:950 length:549 start_codon:yes stop_codon:yes gene_type:complete